MREVEEEDGDICVVRIEGDSEEFVLNKREYERIGGEVKEVIK